MQILEYIDNSIIKLIFGVRILVEMEQNSKTDVFYRITSGLNNLQQIKQFVYYLLVCEENSFHNLLTGDVQYIYKTLSSNKDQLIKEYCIDYKIVQFLTSKGYDKEEIISYSSSNSSISTNIHGHGRIKRLEKIGQMLSYYNSSSLGNYYKYYYTDITRTFKLRTLDLWSLLDVYK